MAPILHSVRNIVNPFSCPLSPILPADLPIWPGTWFDYNFRMSKDTVPQGHVA